MRVTPEKIDTLLHNQIFVFGSNEAGVHGAGAAYQAVSEFGAQMRVGFGRSGNTFAIPTKDWEVKTLGTYYIAFYIERFIEYAKIHPNLTFLVTKIGCGLAGYTPEDIAPPFENAQFLDNVYLPAEFWKHIND